MEIWNNVQSYLTIYKTPCLSFYRGLPEFKCWPSSVLDPCCSECLIIVFLRVADFELCRNLSAANERLALPFGPAPQVAQLTGGGCQNSCHSWTLSLWSVPWHLSFPSCPAGGSSAPLCSVRTDVGDTGIRRLELTDCHHTPREETAQLSELKGKNTHWVFLVFLRVWSCNCHPLARKRFFWIWRCNEPGTEVFVTK